MGLKRLFMPHLCRCYMEKHTRAYLQIHTAVLLYGLTGILGDLISIPKPTLVWWRMLFTVLSFLLWPGVVRDALSLDRKVMLRMAGIGVLVAIHWVTFFGSIALTNASVTLAMFASTTFFTALFEPILTGRKFKAYELLLGLAIVPGVALVVGSTDFGILGIVVALFSALVAAIFSILNKGLVTQHNPITMTMVELGAGFLLLSVLSPFYYGFMPELPFLPVGLDWLYLSILAFVCTSFAYVITLRSLQVLPTFAVNLTINLEPVYTMVIAYFFLNDAEELNLGFYIGAGVIILSVFFHPFLARIFDKPEAAERPH
jgi:drug/metabolite transporter (DMT)-like permease